MGGTPEAERQACGVAQLAATQTLVGIGVSLHRHPPVPLGLVSLSPISTRLLKRMAEFKLAKHNDDCTWRLTHNWQAILNHLGKQIPEVDKPKPQKHTELPPPFIADTGVDTLYIFLLADELPPHLQDACADLNMIYDTQQRPCC